MEPVSEESEVGYDLASVGARIGARIIDSLIGFAVWVTLFFTVVAANDIDLTDTELDIADSIPDGAAFLLRWAPFVAWVAYEAIMTATRGQTVGKILTRIKVITSTVDETPQWGPALMRWAVLAVPMALIPNVIGLAVSLLVGFWFLWDAKRQGLHDKAATTLVVRVPAATPAE